jgi:hypothetical protein
VRRNAACELTFRCGDTPSPECGLFPMPVTVMQDPVSSEEADASCLWTAIGNILAWRRPSAPPKVRSVLPIFACSDSGHQRTWEACDSSLTRIACNCLGAYGARPIPSIHSPTIQSLSEQNRLPSYKELMMHIKCVQPSESGLCFTF